MAAFYSPNGRVLADSEALAHSRNLSTLSNSPLLTNRTPDNHPTDPLLRPPLPPIPTDYYENSSRKLANDDIAGPSPNRLNRTASSSRAQRSVFRRALHAFEKRAKHITLSLELVICTWATYNAVRYFLAFMRYSHTLGQAFSLSLAISAGLSSVLTFWTLILSTYILKCVSSHDGDMWHPLLLSLRLLAAVFLLIPAVVNIAVVFVWKASPNSDLDLDARCHLGVDVVWSTAPNKCPIEPPAWSLWVALAFIRFVVTASLIAIYLTASFFTFGSPTRCSHRHSRSDREGNEPSLTRITSLTDHHPSNLTLVTFNSDSSPQRGLPRSLRSRSSDTFADYSSYGPAVTPGEYEMSGFVDRFRSLITQITREMEDSLEAARSTTPSFAETNGDYAPLPKPYASEFNDIIDANDDNYDFSHYDKDNMFNLPPLPMALGYNEFGVPYPPEQNVRVLGGVVRRMPTIESMGSGEITSRSSATSHQHDVVAGNQTSSRPSTRTTLLTVSTVGHDGMGSNPPSRANSLSGGAEILLALSEHGELPSRGLSTPSSGDVTFRSLSSNTDDAGSSLASRGTVTTYHTASVNSNSPTSVYQDGIPVERDI